MSQLRRYRASRLFVWPAALIYAAVAFAARPPGQIEFFPFFNWSLFTFGQMQRADIVLLVRSIDGQKLPQPAQFYDLKHIFPAARAKDSSLMKLLDRWRAATLNGEHSTADEIRAVVEDTFMTGAASVEYELVVIGYDPLRRIKDGTIEHVMVVGSFEKSVK